MNTLVQKDRKVRDLITNIALCRDVDENVKILGEHDRGHSGSH